MIEVFRIRLWDADKNQNIVSKFYCTLEWLNKYNAPFDGPNSTEAEKIPETALYIDENLLEDGKYFPDNNPDE